MKNLEHELSKHQSITLGHGDGGYRASLYTEDADQIHAFGSTIQEALKELDAKIGPRLEDWEVVADDRNPYVPPECVGRSVKGNVYGHPNIEDGSRVRTSTIREMGDGFVRTANSEYRLGKPHPRYLKWCEENEHKSLAIASFLKTDKETHDG